MSIILSYGLPMYFFPSYLRNTLIIPTCHFCVGISNSLFSTLCAGDEGVTSKYSDNLRKNKRLIKLMNLGNHPCSHSFLGAHSSVY